MNDKSLAKRIKKIRENSGLTQQEFAKSLGVSQSKLSKVENAITEPTIKMLEELKAKYSINLNELFHQ